MANPKVKQVQIQAVQHFDKNPLKSNHQTVQHNPDKFIIDFKEVYPQFTPDKQGIPTIVVNHKVILLDPYIAKELYDLLNNNITKYEEKFGKIKIPESIKKAKKEFEALESKQSAANTSKSLTYMG